MKDNDFYVGYTEDPNRRLKLHNSGKVKSIKAIIPFKLLYYEAYINQKDALKREKYLKTSYGKKNIKGRIKEYLHGSF